MKRKPIYTLSMAKYLVDQGFEVIGEAPNKLNLARRCWFFRDTAALRAACKEYTAVGKHRGGTSESHMSPTLIAKMHTQYGLTPDSIATITGKPIDDVRAAIKTGDSLNHLFAVAAMTDNELKEFFNAKNENERNRLISARVERGGYVVYGGGKVFEYPTCKEAGEANYND